MVRKPQRLDLIQYVVVLALTLVLAPGAWAASKYEVLYSFQGGSDGASPSGRLTFDAAGNLYGATYFGGIDEANCGSGGLGCGTAFKLTPGAGGWKKSLLYTFCSQSSCADGALPTGDLVLDATGALYGTTAYGGGCPSYYGCGTAFELAPDSKGHWQHTVLYQFQGGSDAVNPDGGLVFDRKGNLYGTGGGVTLFQIYIQFGAVFVLTPASGSWTEKVLYNFCPRDLNCSNGFSPTAALVWGADGDLYGATYYGGQESFACDNECGVLFKLTHNSKDEWKENVLHRLVGADGAHPMSGLISDGHGNLYGTTTADGAFGDGTAFSLASDSNGHWKYSVLHEFSTGYLGGGLFRSGLVLDAKGNLYGTTWTGGRGNCGGSGCGLVYKLTREPHGRWKYSELYKFTGGQDGGLPSSGLIPDKKGNLYGLTEFGGADGYGVVFEMTP